MALLAVVADKAVVETTPHLAHLSRQTAMRLTHLTANKQNTHKKNKKY